MACSQAKTSPQVICGAKAGMVTTRLPAVSVSLSAAQDCVKSMIPGPAVRQPDPKEAKFLRR